MKNLEAAGRLYATAGTLEEWTRTNRDKHERTRTSVDEPPQGIYLPGEVFRRGAHWKEFLREPKKLALDTQKK